MTPPITAARLAETLSLGDILRTLFAQHAEHVAHWPQGEFHHDHLFRLRGEATADLFIVVSTNCNAGVKEVLLLDDAPSRWALWRWRCPDNPEFEGALPGVLEVARTVHYFDPCALLRDDARSELRPECRRRVRGGGWAPR